MTRNYHTERQTTIAIDIDCRVPSHAAAAREGGRWIVEYDRVVDRRPLWKSRCSDQRDSI